MEQYPYPFSQAAKLDPRIISRPAYDAELVKLLDATTVPVAFDLDSMRGVSEDENRDSQMATIIKQNPSLAHMEYSIPGPEKTTIIVSVFTPKHPSTTPRPVLYYMHGGGLVSGDRFAGLGPVFSLLEGIDCIVASIEYRLSPETPQPGPSEDCYAGLVWLADHTSQLGIDSARIVLCGISGGGIVATAVCLMARDREFPATRIKGLMLYAPQLDDRCNTLSDQQYEFGSPISTPWVRACWDLVLPHIRGTDSVTSYHAPARAKNYSNLPPTYVDVGECEALRDQAVHFAMDMWRFGSTCELHIWPGAHHVFELADAPQHLLIQSAMAAKRNWFKRMMMAGDE